MGAVKRKRATKAPRHRRDLNYAWMKVIQEASALASSQLEYGEAFGAVAEALRRVAPIDQFMIVLEDRGEAVFVVVESPADHPSTVDRDTRLPLDGSFLGHLKGLGRAYIVRDLRREQRFPEDLMIARGGMRSCARIPLYSAGHFLGMMSVSSHRPRAFTPAHLPHLESLAVQVAHTVANIQRYQQAKTEADRLAVIVREVHHRIKNNLQGVIGLLGRHREDHPQAGPVLTRAIGQLYAIAEVHNLLSRQTRETVGLNALIEGVCRVARALSPHQIQSLPTEATAKLCVPASEAVPIALILNELIQNATNHGYPDNRLGTVRVALDVDPEAVYLRVANDGIAPARESASGVGLDLVRALLPTKGARFRLYREGEWTVGEVTYARTGGLVYKEEDV
ncbi:hypothetical protein SVA_1839 [Sulfurifustis variabilis]|uniref:histidine kinase n=1 Tax=Sulfurifustis variabilis TaxID=1675686 RepID=A0A1B4V4B6_9GAMM|nr:GAF domain-containing protein [Sulfurifustis variabilis]BAU48393.1 hypothetical protein SVA_1839 [Sulfurifustis variabilis]